MSAVDTVFISADELKSAFGVKQLDKLKRVLAMNNIPFLINGAGQPITTQRAIDKSMGLTDDIEQPTNDLDLSWMQKDKGVSHE